MIDAAVGTTPFQRLVFPALDRLNGTRIGQVLRFLDSAERWSRDDLRALQEKKLAALMHYTREHVQRYSAHWNANGEGPDSDFALLRWLPLVTKKDLRDDSTWGPSAWPGRVVRSRTSGSTGQPMVFVRSLEQESWFWALRFRIWQWAGYRMGEPYLTINLNPRLAWKKRLQDKVFRCSYLTYNADNLDSERIVACLAQKRITHLNGFSSSLYELARYMDRSGVRNPGVKAVTATGDMLFPHYRELLERVFGVKVVDYYGAGGEGLHLASQCEIGGSYHLHPENAIVELVAGDRLAKPGELGRIVVTQLDNYAMPLVRYDIGDTAVLDPVPCACGRGHAMLKSVEGRTYDIVYAPNGTALLPHFFVVAFKELDAVSQCQAVQRESDRIVVKLVAQPGCDQRAAEQRLRATIARATHGSLDVTCEWVPDIPLSGAGKRRVVVSHLCAAS